MEMLVTDVISLPFSQPVPVLGLVLLTILYFFWRRSKALDVQLSGAVLGRPDGGNRQDADYSFLSAPDYLHQEGILTPAKFMINNTPSAVPWHNDYCSGLFIALHRATNDKELNKSGNYQHGEYFLGKKRLWELRLNFRFKRTPPRACDLFFGIELERYVPMNRSTKRTMETLVSMLKRVVGNQVYHSPGDNPQVVSGELEPPVFVMPLWAFDQFIVTPENEVAPSLTDPALPSMGSVRVKRIKQFKREVEALEFRIGPTYTFCFWGISQWLDKLQWQMRMPLMSPIDFNLFCGSPPVRAVIYTLAAQEGEKRHLTSRKRYYFEIAFWSSKSRPPVDRIKELLKDPVDSPVQSSEDERTNSRGRGLNNGLSKRGQKNGRWLPCCTDR